MLASLSDDAPGLGDCPMRTLRVLVVCLVSATLIGCATGRTADGREVRGFLWGDDNIVAAAQQVGGTVGGVLGGPAGATIGTAVAGALAAAFAGVAGLRRGERRGWDEKQADLDRARLERCDAVGALRGAARRAENVAG